jgi:hypothetical protein
LPLPSRFQVVLPARKASLLPERVALPLGLLLPLSAFHYPGPPLFWP